MDRISAFMVRVRGTIINLSVGSIFENWISSKAKLKSENWIAFRIVDSKTTTRKA